MLLFFFNDTATTEIYTLSLHDALPICGEGVGELGMCLLQRIVGGGGHRLPRPPPSLAGLRTGADQHGDRSEEHTSELQSRQYLVCRLLLEKKKTLRRTPRSTTTRI